LAPLVLFLGQAIGISLSGVMAPGPVTAATLGAGTRSKHAGALIAVGHGIVEFPLMLLVLGGMVELFEIAGVSVLIGAAGGGFLLYMGVQMLRDAGKRVGAESKYAAMNPIWIGIVLTGGNPYFLLWWVSVGLALTKQAFEFGRLGFALFALVHWLCDLVWLEILSRASFVGSEVFGQRTQRAVLGVCGAALIVLGGLFVVDAATDLWVLKAGTE
jgi:threonine/homoserine/homoserine lactone efflux protein